MTTWTERDLSPSSSGALLTLLRPGHFSLSSGRRNQAPIFPQGDSMKKCSLTEDWLGRLSPENTTFWRTFRTAPAETDPDPASGHYLAGKCIPGQSLRSGCWDTYSLENILSYQYVINYVINICLYTLLFTLFYEPFLLLPSIQMGWSTSNNIGAVSVASPCKATNYYKTERQLDTQTAGLRLLWWSETKNLYPHQVHFSPL